MSRIPQFLALFLVSFLVMAAWGCAQAPTPQARPTKFVSITTAPTGGTWYIVGAGVAKLINKYVPGVQATSEVTGGALENARLMGTKKAVFGFLTSDAAYMAYHGEGPFRDAKYPNLRMMFGGQIGYQHFFTLATSPIKAPQDLKGKRVALTSLGSTGEVMANRTLEEYGFKRGTDYKADFLNYVETVQGMKDGNIDAAVQVLGIPATAVTDLTTTQAVRFIPLDEPSLKRLKEKYPYYDITMPLPAGTYKGLTQAVPTISVGHIFATIEDTDAELVYQVTKAVLEHTEELAEIHPAGRDWSAQNAATVGTTIPFHPGAERYLKEKRLLK